MKTFVTGSTGLLGNNLVRALRAKGHDVVGLVRSEEKAKRLLGETGATWVVGDIRDSSSYAAALEGVDVVFHTAAYFREYYQPGDHAAVIDDTNVRGTLDLMKAADAAGVKKLVHTSSSGTIGSKADGSPGDEDTAPPPLAKENLYFKSKVDGEAKIRAFRPENDLEVIEILPGWMWGPGDEGPTGAGQLALDFLAKKVPAIPPGGTNVVDARDVAESMIRAAEVAHHGAKFIVAGPPRTLGDLLGTLEQVSGVKAPTTHMPYALAYVVASFSEALSKLTGSAPLISRMALKTMNNPARVSSARAERELGATFRPFEDTARDVVTWYRAREA
ncbi:MAG TPA: SDR family oxidoreductase [Polyangiaceae bacterium]